MNIKFDLAKIRFDKYFTSSIELLFFNDNNQILYYNGACFYFVDNDFNSGDLWVNMKLNGEIVGIRQTSDFVYILKLAEGTIARILYLENKDYPDGVAQRVLISRIHDNGYKSDLDEFESISQGIEIGFLMN